MKKLDYRLVFLFFIAHFYLK